MSELKESLRKFYNDFSDIRHTVALLERERKDLIKQNIQLKKELEDYKKVHGEWLRERNA